MTRIIEYLQQQSKTHLLILGLLFVFLVGILDHLTGPQLFFSIFYLFPIFWVTWFTERRIGMIVSLASAVTWLIADFTSGASYSHPAIPYWNASVRLGTFLILTSILSSLKDSLERDRELAKTDALTGVANGRYFMELADREINRASRYRHPFTVAFIDLDNFKAVNDRYGHSAGDTLLYLVADTIQKNVRATDIVARLGGDEFVILLPETGPAPAQAITQKIQRINSDAIRKNDWPVTFSMGVATFIRPPSSVDEMLKISDDLMYAAKKNGKNTIQFEVFGKKVE
jgi:diguanylate cyclase (GGDEF)-like protein